MNLDALMPNAGAEVRITPRDDGKWEAVWDTTRCAPAPYPHGPRYFPGATARAVLSVGATPEIAAANLLKNLRKRGILPPGATPTTMAD